MGQGPSWIGISKLYLTIVSIQLLQTRSDAYFALSRETYCGGMFWNMLWTHERRSWVVVIKGQGQGIIMGDGMGWSQLSIPDDSLDPPSAKHVWTRISHSLRETHFRAPFRTMWWVHVGTHIVMVHGHDGPWSSMSVTSFDDSFDTTSANTFRRVFRTLFAKRTLEPLFGQCCGCTRSHT